MRSDPRDSVKRTMADAVTALREWVDANQDRMIAVLDRALEAERPRIVGSGIMAKVEMIPDTPTKLRAIAAAIERFVPGPLPAGQTQGYVYFVRGGDKIKIGFSRFPVELGRLRELQVGSPVPLEVIGQRTGTKPTERAYHKLFASARVHGEWFEATPELLAEAEFHNG